jgi:hypothetical protein
MTQSRPTVWRNVRRWLPGVLISLIAIAALFQLSNWEDISLAFTALQPVNYAVAFPIDRHLAWNACHGMGGFARTPGDAQ